MVRGTRAHVSVGCEALQRWCIMQAWGSGEEMGGNSLRWEGAKRRVGVWGARSPGPGSWFLLLEDFCCWFLLLEDLRREKNLICFMIEEGGTWHPHLPAQPPSHPPLPAFSSRGHLPEPLKLGS